MKAKDYARTLALVGGAVVLTAMAPGAAQGAADESPVGGEFAHTHHVHTGNGGCIDIDSVRFEPAGRGLHRGVEEAEPLWHGTCSGLVFPGGPPLPSFVPHH